MCKILDNSVHVNGISRRYSFTFLQYFLLREFCNCLDHEEPTVSKFSGVLEFARDNFVSRSLVDLRAHPRARIRTRSAHPIFC